MHPRAPERGSAMLVTLIVIAALIAGATVLAQMQLAATHSSDYVRSSTEGLYCAEAGLAAAAPVVAANYAQWASALAASGATTPDTSEPSWLASGIGSHDIDGDGVADFSVYLVDDDDEVPSDRTRDQNLKVFIVSTCLKYTETPHVVEELVQMSGGGTCYKSQIGGCRNDNNTN